MKKVTYIFITVVVAVIALMVAYNIYNLLVFRITSTNPKNHSTVPSVIIKADISFSQKIKKISDINNHITGDTQTIQGFTQSDKKLTVYFNTLDIDKSYTFTIKNIESTNGKKLKDSPYTFKTKYVEANKLSKGLQAELNSQTDAILEQQQRQYPLLKKLPIDTLPLYKITGGQSKKYPNDKTKVAIYIISDSPADTQNALDYIRGLGFDPSDYEFVFQKINGEGQ